ncbi:MAG: ABC transporter permease [Desulfovibrionales bacterium]|nr:ABC transporter permease [Desulfovibrionales bacterium]
MIYNYLLIALRSLAEHKIRSLLAMLGVFFGTFAITGVVHVSSALEKQAAIEAAKLGPNLMVILAGQPTFRRGGTLRYGGVTTTFKLEDYEAVMKNNPYVKNGTPFVSNTDTVKYRQKNITTQVIAGNADYDVVRATPVAIGKFFTKEEVTERAKVCILGFDIAQRLFSSQELAMGKIVQIGLTNLRVIGVMPMRGRDLSGTNQDEQLFVPLTTYMRRMSNQDWVTGVCLTLFKNAPEELAKQTCLQIMRRQHGVTDPKEDDFLVVTAKDVSKLQTQALKLVWILGVMSSSISFTIGAMGILSIMILLVQTRKLEIGIRRAIGARRSAIILQFLFEASLLSGIGGTLGAICAVATVTVVYYFHSLPFVYKPLFILVTSFGSGILGILAGAYPAWKASRVNVLQVLRNH